MFLSWTFLCINHIELFNHLDNLVTFMIFRSDMVNSYLSIANQFKISQEFSYIGKLSIDSAVHSSIISIIWILEMVLKVDEIKILKILFLFLFRAVSLLLFLPKLFTPLPLITDYPTNTSPHSSLLFPSLSLCWTSSALSISP